jgi:hypothetical protein
MDPFMRLRVDKEEGLKEFRHPGPGPHPLLLTAAGRFISYLFHPVFIPVFITALLVFRHPYLFLGFSHGDKVRVLLQAFLMFTFFPLITVLLLRGLRFIDSIRLNSQRDRIIPLVACGIWYFWIWYVWRNLPEYPPLLVELALAVWISSTLALLANIRMKVSLHGIAAGVMTGFAVQLALTQDLPSGLFLTGAFIVTGLIATARLLVSDHTTGEVYGGLLLGGISLLIAALAS